jgi:hypothetical protein
MDFVNRFFRNAGVAHMGIYCLVGIATALFLLVMGIVHMATCGKCRAAQPAVVAQAAPAKAAAAAPAATVVAVQAPAVVAQVPTQVALLPSPAQQVPVSYAQVAPSSQNHSCVFGCVATSHVSVATASATATTGYKPDPRYAGWGDAAPPAS